MLPTMVLVPVARLRKGRPPVKINVSVGDLIYIKSDGDKHTTQDLYIVTSTEPDHLFAQKLVGSQFCSWPNKLQYQDIYKGAFTSRSLHCESSSTDVEPSSYKSTHTASSDGPLVQIALLHQASDSDTDISPRDQSDIDSDIG